MEQGSSPGTENQSWCSAGHSESLVSLGSCVMPISVVTRPRPLFVCLSLWDTSHWMGAPLIQYDLILVITPATTLFPNKLTFGDTGGQDSNTWGWRGGRTQFHLCQELTPNLSVRAEGPAGGAPHTVSQPAFTPVHVVVTTRFVQFLVSSLSLSRLLSNRSCVYFC